MFYRLHLYCHQNLAYYLLYCVVVTEWWKNCWCQCESSSQCCTSCQRLFPHWTCCWPLLMPVHCLPMVSAFCPLSQLFIVCLWEWWLFCNWILTRLSHKVNSGVCVCVCVCVCACVQVRMSVHECVCVCVYVGVGGEMDGWMDGLLYNLWFDHNNIVGEQYVNMIKFKIHWGILHI